MIGVKRKKGFSMQKRRVFWAVVLSLLLTLGAFTAAVHADFGDFGGDYDYGGNDSYDYDFGNDYDYDDNDRDYDYGGSYSGGTTSSSSSDFSFGGAVLIAAIILVVFYLSRRRKSGGSSVSVAPGAQATDPSTLRPMGEYTQLDP